MSLAIDWLLMCVAAAILIMLGACALPEPVTVRVPVPQPVEVKVAVPVPCVKAEDVPALPALPPPEALAALPDYELLITIEELRRRLVEYALKADAVLQGCAK
jgi:hypothetical protein